MALQQGGVQQVVRTPVLAVHMVPSDRYPPPSVTALGGQVPDWDFGPREPLAHGCWVVGRSDQHRPDVVRPCQDRADVGADRPICTVGFIRGVAHGLGVYRDPADAPAVPSGGSAAARHSAGAGARDYQRRLRDSCRGSSPTVVPFTAAGLRQSTRHQVADGEQDDKEPSAVGAEIIVMTVLGPHRQ
jgi:hypothetical protein